MAWLTSPQLLSFWVVGRDGGCMGGDREKEVLRRE